MKDQTIWTGDDHGGGMTLRLKIIDNLPKKGLPAYPVGSDSLKLFGAHTSQSRERSE
jgi:hypothetical protein